MSEHEVFRTTLMGGYDKDDVLERLRNIKDSAMQEKNKLLKDLTARDEIISDLKRRLDEKDAQRKKLEQEINEKYKKYIDHYESITHLLVESQIKADTIVADAKKKSEQILKVTDEEVKRKIDSVQSEIDEKLIEGKRKYVAVQDELNEIVELINQAQKRFMTSYKEVHQIVRMMPESLKGLEEEALDVDSGALSTDDILTRVQAGLNELRDESLDDPDDPDEVADRDISRLVEKYSEE